MDRTRSSAITIFEGGVPEGGGPGPRSYMDVSMSVKRTSSRAKSVRKALGEDEDESIVVGGRGAGGRGFSGRFSTSWKPRPSSFMITSNSTRAGGGGGGEEEDEEGGQSSSISSSAEEKLSLPDGGSSGRGEWCR